MEESTEMLLSNKRKIKNTIDDFIISDSESVILLKGEWGIGKTYLIEELQKEYQKNTDKEFLYVSLLGLDNIEEVKNRIISPYRREKELRILSGDFLKAISDSIPKGNLAANIATSIFDYIAENRLKNKIIIIDDLERKGDKLSMLSLFGLIDFLKKKKNKIIILTNEEKLVKADGLTNSINSDSWQILKEKIIDREMQLIINYKDCLDILMIKEKNNSLEYKAIKQLLSETKLINLRIISLIRNRIKEMLIICKKKCNEDNEDILIQCLINASKMFYIYYIQENHEQYLIDFKKHLSQSSAEKAHFNEYSNQLDNNKTISEVYSFLDSISINNIYDLSKIYDVVYNCIKWGFWDNNELNLVLDNILNDIILIKNEALLEEFVDNVKYGKISDFDMQISNFLTLKIKNPGKIFDIYDILKKLNHNKKYLYKDKIDSFNFQFSPSQYTENTEFINPAIQNEQNKRENIKESLFKMLYFHLKEDYVKNYLNSITEEQLIVLLEAEINNNNMKLIFESIFLIKNDPLQEYKNFIITLQNLFKHIKESSENTDTDIKRIILLNPID